MPKLGLVIVSSLPIQSNIYISSLSLTTLQLPYTLHTHRLPNLLLIHPFSTSPTFSTHCACLPNIARTRHELRKAISVYSTITAKFVALHTSPRITVEVGAVVCSSNQRLKRSTFPRGIRAYKGHRGKDEAGGFQAGWQAASLNPSYQHNSSASPAASTSAFALRTDCCHPHACSISSGQCTVAELTKGGDTSPTSQ